MAEIIQESKSLSDCSLTVALYFRLHNTKKAKGPNKSGIYWVTETFNTFSHTLFNLAQTRNPQRILFCTLVMSYAHICCVSCTALSEASTSKPYQGVRVKDPVKELLRRKRGNAARTIPPSAVGTRAHVCTHTHSIRHAFDCENCPLTLSHLLFVQVLACFVFLLFFI